MATQTQVLIAHTGQRLQVDSSQFSDLDEFKESVSRQSAIPAQHVVALTPQGKSVKIQTIQSEKEIYVYDIRIIQASSAGAATSLVSESPMPSRYQVTSAPNSIDDAHSVRSWQDLFKKRRDWALRILEECQNMMGAAQARYAEMDVLLKCLDAAVANLDTALKPMEPKYMEFKRWATPAQEEYASLTSNWESYIELARSVTVSAAMVRFMTGQDARRPRQATLEDLIDPGPTRKAGNLAATSLQNYNNKVSDLDKTADKLFNGCDELFREFDKLLARSSMQHVNDCKQLLEDIEAVAHKIDTDYQTTLQYTNQPKDISQASKIAANHTKQLLPSMQNRAMEMDEMLRYVTKARNEVAADSLTLMRSIAELTTLHQDVKTQMNLMNKVEEEMTTFDYLRLIHQLPFMYTSFVIESIRRREWTEKIKTDSSTLVNEMALFQDEELKRRRKWEKMIGNTYGPERITSHVLGLEVNIRGEEEQWPELSREELDDFLANIKQQNADPAVVTDVAKLIDELNNPTKQQYKRLKAFKNGSVHEAALGRSGLLIRGDDELIRSLQGDKTKLESRLKTAESRVRRLEDLLHRHTQASRPSIFPSPTTDQNNSSSSIRASPASHENRRSSISDNTEVLLQRLSQLEAELNTERERSAGLQKKVDAHAEHIDETNSTKQDLLGNMEALKREFMGERKSYEDEIKQLKARLEETEDVMVQSMQDEIDRLNNEKRDEALKVQGQLDFLRNEARTQRERNSVLEKELREARDMVRDLTKEAEAVQEATETHAHSLRELLGQLSPTESTPQDFSSLTNAVVRKSTIVLSKLKSLEEDYASVKDGLSQADGIVKQVRSELSTTEKKLSSEEMTVVNLRELLDQEKTKCATLESEIQIGRDQVNEMRAKMTEGATDSEALRVKLEAKEKKISELTQLLASRQSQVGGLEEEVRVFQEKLQSTEATLATLSKRFEDRTIHSKDLTRRLYTHNERLCKLLERLGFSVTRTDESMVIQRIPRSERNPPNPGDSSDPGSSIRRSVTLANSTLSESADLRLIYWMNAEDSATEEEQYQAFITGPGNFDIDAFSETIYRRMKEIEHTARKMTRDARGFRERTHAATKEAHEKIAFRHFKEGDLALFLPTRNQTAGAWAAFNVGCPHFFLREQESHRLRNREWLVARITRIQERVVDLSKSLQSNAPPSENETDSINTGDDNDNPFDLSDGLRWWLIDAHEDKPGAPSTPGLGKSTVASNRVEAVANMHSHGPSGRPKSKLGSNGGIEGVSRTLSRSLESRRSSSGSKKAVPFAAGSVIGRGSALASETNSLRAVRADSPAIEASPVLESSIVRPGSTRSTQEEPLVKTNHQDKGKGVAAPNTPDEVRSALDSLMGP